MSLSLIKQIELDASKIPGVISLAQGIPSFSLPEAIKKRLKSALDLPQINKYTLTTGLPQLREAVSIDLETIGIHADPESEILITSGAIEGITATLLTLAGPGDEVILPGPCYASYIGAVQVTGAKIVWARFDADDVRSKITKKTKAVLFANPNNPTGELMNKADLIKVAKLCQSRGVYIIVDEVYRDFVYGKEKYFSLASMPAYRDTVVSIYSFSKSYAMTGFRVGYIVAAAALLTEILKVHDVLTNSAPSISQYAALFAVEFAERSKQEFLDEFSLRRAYVLEWLESQRKYFGFAAPQGAYFVFPSLQVPSLQDDKKFAAALLSKAKVAVVPGSAFGPLGAGHIRISYGAELGKIKLGLERIEEFITSLS